MAIVRASPRPATDDLVMNASAGEAMRCAVVAIRIARLASPLSHVLLGTLIFGALLARGNGAA